MGPCVAGGGLGDELRQPVFSLGMKGVKPEDANRVCQSSMLQCIPWSCCWQTRHCDAHPQSRMRGTLTVASLSL